MNYIIIISLLLLLIFFTYKRLIINFKITTFHISNLLLVLFIVTFVGLIIAFPRISFSSASSGLNLWFNVVFPSLLPFLIASELLIGLGFVNFLGALFEPFMRSVFNVPGEGSFALAMGLSSGYPTGAKITSNLREKNLCTKTEGERLLTFTNNSGPLFIIGAVSVGMFNNPVLGYILAIAHYSAALTVGFLFRFYKRSERSKISVEKNKINIFRKAIREMFKARRNDNRSLGTLLGDSVKNAINLLLMVGGFIVLFSVILALLNQLNVLTYLSNFFSIFLAPFGIDSSIINSILSGLFEITNGCKLASTSSTIYIQKVVAAAFILGWAGLSVHMQVISIIGRTDISPLPYLFSKLCHGMIAAIYSFILFSYISVFEKTYPAFSPIYKTQNLWVNNLINSSEFLLGILIVFLVIGTISILSKQNTRNI